MDNIGVVGSPSTTLKVSVDILEDATGLPLQGQLVYFSHQLEAGHLFALGTVTDIETTNRCMKTPTCEECSSAMEVYHI
jgi:hypothetical protein